MQALVPSTLNFLLLIGGLVYFLRKPIQQFIYQRHVSVRDEVLKVRSLLRRAQEKYDESSLKLKMIDAEVSALREQAVQDARNLRERIVSEARRHSVNWVNDARGAAENLYSELRRRLFTDLGTRAIDRAEVVLRERLTQDDRLRIKHEFSKQVETFQ